LNVAINVLHDPDLITTAEVSVLQQQTLKRDLGTADDWEAQSSEGQAIAVRRAKADFVRAMSHKASHWSLAEEDLVHSFKQEDSCVEVTIAWRPQLPEVLINVDTDRHVRHPREERDVLAGHVPESISHFPPHTVLPPIDSSRSYPEIDSQEFRLSGFSKENRMFVYVPAQDLR
jgi:hypothetical protein